MNIFIYFIVSFLVLTVFLYFPVYKIVFILSVRKKEKKKKKELRTKKKAFNLEGQNF